MSRQSSYTSFLRSKIEVAPISGFGQTRDEINPKCKPHQMDAIEWGLAGGCRAIFASFGLGKSFMQLEMMRITVDRYGSKGLIVCPLGVRSEFFTDAKKLGIDLVYVKSDADVAASTSPMMITNFERVRDGQVSLNGFRFASLDEASVLRTDNSKTHHTFIKLFKRVPFRFVCTATPSPNEYIEVIFYAEFLGIMDKGQAKTRFFKRDSTKADKLTLLPHKEEEFWLWVSTWALFITKPSDLGYSNEGYDLPPLHVHWHSVSVDHAKPATDRNGNTQLFRNAAASLSQAAREKRDSLPARVDELTQIVQDHSDDHLLIWHDLEAERKAIEKALPDAALVYGSQDLEQREQHIVDFAQGKIKYLGTKPQISGSGCNFQRHCHRAVFLGIGFKFNDFIQAIHRIFRFLQEHEVHIHIIYAESEEPIRLNLEGKWKRHDTMVASMSELLRKYGIGKQTIQQRLQRSIGVERKLVRSEHYEAVRNDCVLELQSYRDDSQEMFLTSIPFGTQYEYTPSYNDFGHNADDDAFFRQMDYLVPELLRTLKPGRVAAIHVKDRILFGNYTGYGMPSLNPFSDKVTQAFMKHGFVFFGRITVVTDVVRENNQTYRLGWSEQCKDGTKMGVGMPEYVLLFRKLPTDTSKAYADEPVQKSKDEYSRGQWQVDAHGYWRSDGNRFVNPEEWMSLTPEHIQRMWGEFSRHKLYNYEKHVGLARKLDEASKLPTSYMALAPASLHPEVWTDVVRIKTLNTKQSQRQQQQHLCPLQFDIVDRLINRYTNPGEWVTDPFAGLFTVPYRAMKLGRKGRGIELNHDYFTDGVAYCRSMEHEITAITLFDALETLEEVAKR